MPYQNPKIAASRHRRHNKIPNARYLSSTSSSYLSPASTNQKDMADTRRHSLEKRSKYQSTPIASSKYHHSKPTKLRDYYRDDRESTQTSRCSFAREEEHSRDHIVNQDLFDSSESKIGKRYSRKYNRFRHYRRSRHDCSNPSISHENNQSQSLSISLSIVCQRPKIKQPHIKRPKVKKPKNRRHH